MLSLGFNIGRPDGVIWLQCGSECDDIVLSKSLSGKQRNQPMEQLYPKKLMDQVRDGTCLLAVRSRLDQSPLGGLLTRLAAIPIYT